MRRWGSYQTVRFTARRWWNTFLNVLYPSAGQTCLLCQRPIGELDSAKLHSNKRASQADALNRVCLFCSQDALLLHNRPTARRMAIRVTPRQPAPQQRTLQQRTPQQRVITVPVIAARRYEGFVRNSIRRWKYDGMVELTGWFSEWILDAYTQRELDFGHGPSPQQQVLLVPVPTTKDRMRKRGYHHVGLLVQEMAKATGWQVSESLVRVPDAGGTFTQSQTARNVADRHRSLQGKFHVQPNSNLRQSHVLLVDDLVTTGATLNICATELLKAGAKSVTALVVADVE